MRRRSTLQATLAAGCAAAAIFSAGGCRRQDDAPVQVTAAAEPAASPAPEAADPDGAELYSQHCAVCHMADGMGVPNFQPPIVGSPSVTGERAKLEAVIRAGSAALSERENPFGNEMPPFGHLTVAEVDVLVDYVRNEFGTAGGRGK